MKLRRLLRRYLAPYAITLTAVMVLQAIQTAATLVLPTLNADLIDNGVLRGDNAYIWRVGTMMIGFSVVQIVFAAAAVWYGAKAAMGFGRDIRRDLFGRVNGFSGREVAALGAPSLITRVTNDVQQVQMLVVMVATMMIAAPLTLVIGMAMAIREDPGTSWVLAVSIPIAVVVMGIAVLKMVPAYRKMQERIDRINLVLREQITGIRVVRAFVREPQETARFERANASVTEVALTAGRWMSMMYPTVGLILNASSLAVIWVAADRIGAGQMQIGSLVAFLTYLVQILMAVVMFTYMVAMIPRASVASDRLLDVLETESSIHHPEHPVTELREPGSVEFDRVGFSYPGAEHAVLTDISFTVRAGETLAVIGSTGAGKSTLANLVVRLFDATAGTVLVGGVDVRELDPRLLWGRVGYVPQKAFLFSGTVASNLRFGRPGASDGDLWEALEIAQASGFVQSMPGGLDAEVVQGGANLSGGQRQRLAIARALVVDPQVYVFDDSFSALDLATEARLRAALTGRMEHASMILIAQRVSTIRDAEQILVLEDGEMVGLGTHDELLDACETYAEIVTSQYGEGAVA